MTGWSVIAAAPYQRILYAPHGEYKFGTNFSLSLSAPLASLMYFTKKRFRDTLMRGA